MNVFVEDVRYVNFKNNYKLSCVRQKAFSLA